MRTLTIFIAAFLFAAVSNAAPPAARKPVAKAFAIAPRAAPTLNVGALTLTRCGAGYCGSLERDLDPAGAVPGTIAIAFEYYPPFDPSLPRAGALVATEGGPGYPTTGSRNSYLGLLRPLMQDRSLLLVDNRGTGGSAAIHCPALQRDALYRNATIAACGAQLADRSDLYGSGLAADDLAAVIDALRLGPVDLYGDSYGTFFGQAFAARHPSLVRSLVLDGAYAVIGADPWYPEAPAQAQTAFNQACARSPACQGQPGVSMDRIGTLLAALRARPVSGTAPDGDGTLQPVTADAQGLAYAMLSNASGPVVYRDLDAAARAWQDGDEAPFMRLIAENQTSAYGANGAPRAVDFSAGLFAAVSCADYPQIYDMREPLPARFVGGRRAIADKRRGDPGVFAPFTIDEYLAMPQDYSVVNLCLTWPVPSLAHPPAQPVPPDTPFPALPVLVLSGDLDSLTPPAQGAQAAALFPNARQVIVANSYHVTALGDEDDCASAMVRRFVQTLSPGDTSCASRIPEVRLVPRFATQTSQLAPAQATAGNQGSAEDLQTVAAALLTAGDAIARWWINTDGSGVGLRGGGFTYGFANGSSVYRLDRLKWTNDLEVSGSIVQDWSNNRIDATLVVPGGTLHAHWLDRAPLSMATVTGTLGGRNIAGTVYAP
jgi:pimeloyl-ACP methyl ester carboxylesterase